MTYDEFYDIIKEIYSSETTHLRKVSRYWPFGDENEYKVEWITGGMSGGSCWGDQPSWSNDSDPEPELEFIPLFERICPQMTFLQYRKVMKDIVKRASRTQNEYYGNYTTYGVKTVKYQDLYDKLVECGAIDDD